MNAVRVSPLIVGIAGGSGSGKSTIAERLLQRPIGSEIALLQHDSYYLDREKGPDDRSGIENWDHPNALDNALFASHLELFMKGEPFEMPQYDFATHRRRQECLRMDPKPILLVDGILLFAIPEVRERLHLRIFVDTPPEERLARRIIRDMQERQRSLDSVVAQFRGSVRPMHDLFVEPSRVHAHLVVGWDWQHENEIAVDVLASYLEGTLRGIDIRLARRVLMPANKPIK